jgi:flagellar FliL protein
MAKKPKKDAAPEGEGDEASADANAATGGRKKLILFGGIGAVVLALLGGGGYFLFGGHKEETVEKAAVRKPITFLELREMTVNLAPDSVQDRAKFLKFKVSLEVKDPKTLAEVQPLLPRVEDTFQVFLRELRPSDLDGSIGLYRLREELLRRVNVAVYPVKVDALLFKDIVVQ